LQEDFFDEPSPDNVKKSEKDQLLTKDQAFSATNHSDLTIRKIYHGVF